MWAAANSASEAALPSSPQGCTYAEWMFGRTQNTARYSTNFHAMPKGRRKDEVRGPSKRISSDEGTFQANGQAK
eukprot:scaffold203311_cov15-Tisochrysis_lutea.AAC.1